MARSRVVKRRGRAFLWFERTVLGVGMTMAAWFIERRLLKALKKGQVEPAPRTAADEAPEAPSVHVTSGPAPGPEPEGP
jgi:hypothetical protein